MAEVKKQMFWTFFVIPAITIIFIIAGVVISIITSSKGGINKGVEDRIHELKLLGNPECFAYEDKGTGRIYDSYIDVKKFNKETLDYCLDFKRASDKGLMIILKTEGEQDIELISKNLKSSLKGTQVTNQRPVVIVTKDGFYKPGLMTFYYWH